MDTSLRRLLSKVEVRREVMAEASKFINLNLAPRFSIFEFVRRDELGLSKIIAWLLDPKSSHGQGDLFISSFLKILKIDLEGCDLRNAVVRTEAPTDQIERKSRRIDVEVLMGNFVLAIENKPWARWQPNQVRDYLQNIQRKSSEKYCLILIKGVGDKLPELQMKSKEYKNLVEDGRLIDESYSILKEWILKCRDICKPNSVRLFLGDFISFIDEEFGQGGRAVDEDIVTAGILNNIEDRRAAFHLISSRQSLFQDLALRTMTELDRQINGRWQRTGDAFDPADYYKGVKLIIDDAAPFFLAVEFSEIELREPYIGLVVRGNIEKKGAPFPSINESLQNAGFPGRKERYWIWWRWIKEINGMPSVSSDAETWESLVDGSFIEAVLKHTTDLSAKLHETGVLPWREGKWAA